MPALRILGCLIGFLSLAACSQLPKPAFIGAANDCRQRLLSVPGVERSIEGWRPSVQPYFVINRLHAHFSPADLAPEAFYRWRARVVEQSAQVLAKRRGASSQASIDRGCLQQLAEQTPMAHWQAYREEARERDLYHDWQRIVGLYPLAAPVAKARIAAEQAHWQAAYRGPFPGHPVRYQVADLAAGRAQSERLSALDALGLPDYTDTQWQALFARHAPTLQVYQQSSADQLGEVVNRAGQARFSEQRAVAYTSRSLALLGGQWRAQLNYTFWFSHRPKRSALDPYGGRWNGFTWRVTVDESGEPMAAESLHNCGCYHQVWLSDGWRRRAEIEGESPLFLPLDWHGRAQLTVTSGEHFVRDVNTASPDADERYHLVAYGHLDRLSDTARSGPVISFFDHQGIVPGSQRLERFFLWPFGVASPGAMRRLGTHAIAFVGKRYFDDPMLLDALIERQQATQQASGATP
jgi:hypothetical protein